MATLTRQTSHLAMPSASENHHRQSLHPRLLPRGRSFRALREAAQRGRRTAPLELREHTETAKGCQLNERLLQMAWNEGRFPTVLTDVRGIAVEVLSPGTWNVAGGPDFAGAALRVGGRTRKGAVEMHRTCEDWARHGHDRDPAYDAVVLHVVWHRPAAPVPEHIPCVVASECLHEPWRNWVEQLADTEYPYARKVPPGDCAVRWALSDDQDVRDVLTVAGLARLDGKVDRLRRRAVAVGLEQAAYETVMDALGYRANRRAFVALARAVPLADLRTLEAHDERIGEAVLFGAAGLLPDPTLTPVLPECRQPLQALWDTWWQTGRSALTLDWKRNASRPFNSPERRLAAAAKLLAAWTWRPVHALRRKTEHAADARQLLRELDAALRLDSPWEGCRDFQTRLARPGKLLGNCRRRDLIANVLLPTVIAAADHSPAWEPQAAMAREAFTLLPPLQDNRVLKEATHRFLVPASRRRGVVRNACCQQGLIEMYRSFCKVLSGDCAHCPLTATARRQHAGD